jgi:hypothetical protein
MKKLLLTIMFFTPLIIHATDAVKTPSPVNSIDEVQGGVMEYVGTLGKYGIEFNYMNLHMGDGAHFSYRYTTITVNKGQWIELKYAGKKGGYEVWKEYINGKNTGTFTIQWTSQRIVGTFVNSKGKKFKVSAKRVQDNWVDAGDSPF